MANGLFIENEPEPPSQKFQRRKKDGQRHGFENDIDMDQNPKNMSSNRSKFKNNDVWNSITSKFKKGNKMSNAKTLNENGVSDEQ